MKVLNQVRTQTERITLVELSKPLAYRVTVEQYNDEINTFEKVESYGSPFLIDCQIEFEQQVFQLN